MIFYDKMVYQYIMQIMENIMMFWIENYNEICI